MLQPTRKFIEVSNRGTIAINPYEAPQTIERALPPARPPLVPQQGLRQGARRYALGGKLLMAAAISECFGIGVLIWIQQAKQHGPTNLLNLCGWILLSGSWLLLIAGAVVNLLGCSRFVRYLDHAQLVKTFRDCRRVAWVKIVLMIAIVVCTNLSDGQFFLIATIALFTILVGMMIYSYFMHARAMRIWSEHFPERVLVVVRRVYLASGIGANLIGLGLIVISIVNAAEPARILLLGLMLIFALSFAAFADFYGRLGKVLALFEPTDKENEGYADSPLA